MRGQLVEAVAVKRLAVDVEVPIVLACAGEADLGRKMAHRFGNRWADNPARTGQTYPINVPVCRQSQLQNC